MTAATIGALGAVLDWPVVLGVSLILAIAVTVFYFVSRRGDGAGASGNSSNPTEPEKPIAIHAHQRAAL